MKYYECYICGHRWFEPSNNEKKTGWGCPNGCLVEGREIKRDKFSLFEEILDEFIKGKTHEQKKEIVDNILRIVKKKES